MVTLTLQSETCVNIINEVRKGYGQEELNMADKCKITYCGS